MDSVEVLIAVVPHHLEKMDHFEGDNLNESILFDKLTAESVTFAEWVHELREILRSRKIEHALDTPVPELDEDYSPMEEDEYQVSLVLLDRMSPELSDCYPYLRPFRLMEALKARFSFQLCHARYKFYGELTSCKLSSGGSMREHKAKFCKILRKLVDIGHPVPEKQAVDTLLRSLPSYHYAFVACYESMEVEKTVKEVFEMLLSAELDVYVHHLMTSSFLQDKWRVHKSMKRKRVKKVGKKWRKWKNKVLAAP